MDAPRGSIPPAPGDPLASLLVVDSDQILADAVAAVFAQDGRGHEAFTARTPEEARAALESRAIDALLLRWTPDAPRVVELVRASGEPPPVVLVGVPPPDDGDGTSPPEGAAAVRGDSTVRDLVETVEEVLRGGGRGAGTPD